MKAAQAVTLSCLALWSLTVSPANAAQPFQDVTKQVGLEGTSGSVAAWGDYNNDGWVDLYCGGQLWRNAQGCFTRVADASLAGPGVWADFNNDGWLDLFTWAGGGRLFRNVAGKQFTALHETQLPRLPMKVSLAASWGDVNGDGFVDLYVGGYEVWPSEEFADCLFVNQNGKQFVEHWRQQTIRRARGIVGADFDEDGDLDLYVSNYRLQPNLLWRNNGAGEFVDVAAGLGVAGDGALGAWGHTIGSAWGDFDNDGHLDLFVGNFSHPPTYQDRPQFLRNPWTKEESRFEDKSAVAGLHWQESYASPALADFDNDGWLDLFLTTVYAGDASVLYRNQGSWKFEDVTAARAINTATTYQAAWADFDNDGFPDLVSGGRLFRNPGGETHWLKVRLVGSGKVNKAAIGSQVRLKLGDQTLVRQVEGATGQGNQNDLTLHFGLGSASGPVRLDVLWTDGTRQPVDNVAVNQSLVVKKL